MREGTSVTSLHTHSSFLSSASDRARARERERSGRSSLFFFWIYERSDRSINPTEWSHSELLSLPPCLRYALHTLVCLRRINRIRHRSSPSPPCRNENPSQAAPSIYVCQCDKSAAVALLIRGVRHGGMSRVGWLSTGSPALGTTICTTTTTIVPTAVGRITSHSQSAPAPSRSSRLATAV